MNWQVTPYVIGLALATLVSLHAANLALSHKDRPGGPVLGLMLLAIALWCSCYIIEANAVTLAPKILWSQIAYIGTLSAGPLLYHFAARITHRERLLSSPALTAVWTIPCLTLALAFTNGWHGLVWSGFTFLDVSQRILIYERGAWFWFFALHSYAVLIVASGILVEYALKTRHLYQKQTLTILTALTPPWAINIIYLFAPARLNYRDWTPVGFAATGTLLVLAFQRLGLLDLMPIARDLVVEHMQEGVLVLDATGRVVDLNASAERLIDIDGIIGQPVRRLFAAVMGITPSPSMDLKDAPVTDLSIPGDTPRRGELITDTGQTLEWRITPLIRTREHIAGQIVLLRDVTEERSAERALAEMNATLEAQVEARTAEIQAAQERSDVILQSVNDAIVMIDQDAVIRYTNPAFTTITGYTNDEVAGQQLVDVVRGNFHERLGEAQAADQIWQGEVHIQHADGRMIDLAMTITPIHDDNNKITGYVCTGQDISRLINLIRTRKGILDNISHQLRTPVTTLRLYTHLLRNTELSEAQTRTLSVIDEQTTWLQHMIEDILEMTSLESGAAIDQWEAIPADDLISLILDRYQSQIAAAGLQLVTPDLPNSPLIVNGDASRLAQALGEIVSNAIQFTPPGGRLTLSIAQDELENRAAVTIVIADTGPGIPLDEQTRVFERFFRGRLTESGQLPGTGLGLSIAAIIVQAHGGRITLTSDETGSTFTVWLPAAPGTAQAELDFRAN